MKTRIRNLDELRHHFLPCDLVTHHVYKNAEHPNCPNTQRKKHDKKQVYNFTVPATFYRV